MGCSVCGTENEAGRKFCKECGSALSIACPSCGTENSGDSKFCGECGTRLAPAPSAGQAESASRAGQPPSTERRLVSVLFADLVGSTSLAEHRDAEDVRDLLSRYFDAARSAIERHGGLIEKFIGDAVMAVWGAPVAHEDDAERAVRAALEVVDAVEALGRSVGEPLRARAGVLTGEAAASLASPDEGLVAGDMVNTASRLQSAAEPGSVLVGDATYRAASRAIAFEDAGERSLKGKDEPVRAWRALRVVAQRGGAARGPSIEPPFVGRAEELRLLKDHLHAVGREGKARLVSLMGVAGIGKSRLAWEFAKYVDGLTEPVYWHEGRCPAYGDGVTFWALGEMVRMRAGIAETDAPTDSRRKLTTSVEAFVPDMEDRRWIEPRLAFLLGLDERPPGDPAELFSAWRTFFERVAASGTTVMVFEDLQWADPGLIEFVESIVEWSRSAPILVVTLTRPELVDRRPDWGAGQRAFTSVRLEPLPDDDIGAMVRAFVRALPGEAVGRIVQRSEGIPLYAVETVRMLASRGALEPSDDAYDVVGDVTEIDVPDTLHALIAARLDALPAETRSLLQDASVLGKSFTLDALAAVSGAPRDELEATVRDLARKEFVQLDADPRSPERGQYSFVQSLIREVAYGMLGRAERRRRHLAAAHHLESLADDELAGVVATHYVEAFRATPPGPDADALVARARDWLGNAADRATSLGSTEQALGYAEQALEITPGRTERITLLEKAGEAASQASRSERALALYEEGLALAREADDADAIGRMTAGMFRPSVSLDRVDDIAPRLSAAVADLGERLAPATKVRLLCELTGAYVLLGRPADALEAADGALEIAERHHLDGDIALAITFKARALLDLGRHREGVVLLRGGLELAEEHGSLGTKADVLLQLAVSTLEDDPRSSFAYSLEAADAARRAGIRSTELNNITNAVESAADLGDWAVADELVARSHAFAPLEALNDQALSLGVALLAAYRGDDAAASRGLEAVEPALAATAFVQSRTWFQRSKCLVLLMRGELGPAFEEGMAAIEQDPAGMNTPNAAWDAAHAAMWAHDAERARQALAAMGPLRGRWIDAARRTVEAGIAALEGRADEAAASFAGVFDTWAAMELPFDRALAVVDAATVLPGRFEEEVATTRAYLVELGARPLVDRLNAAAGTPAREADAPTSSATPSTIAP